MRFYKLISKSRNFPPYTKPEVPLPCSQHLDSASSVPD